MSDLDIQIDTLRLDVSNFSGPKHRIGPIAERAAAIFAARLAEDLPMPSQKPAAKPAQLDLNRMRDEEAAQAIADGWIRELALKLMV
jgi:hypothetical protein